MLQMVGRNIEHHAIAFKCSADHRLSPVQAHFRDALFFEYIDGQRYRRLAFQQRIGKISGEVELQRGPLADCPAESGFKVAKSGPPDQLGLRPNVDNHQIGDDAPRRLRNLLKHHFDFVTSGGVNIRWLRIGKPDIAIDQMA